VSKKKQTKSYDVGYCKPPVAHQFKPGQSGNPSGSRGRGGKPMLAASIKKALLKKQLVTIDGKQRRMSRIDIIAEELSITAMRGDKEARREALRQVQIIDKLTLLEPDEPKVREVEVYLKIGDEKVTRRIIEREEEQAAEQARAARQN
jgi:hypothetical protein